MKISKKQTAILLLITVVLIIAVSFGIKNWSESKSKNISSTSEKITAKKEESKKEVSNANVNDTKPSTTVPDSQKATTPGGSSTGSQSSTTTTSTKGSGSTSSSSSGSTGSSTKTTPTPTPSPTPAPTPKPAPTPTYTPSYQLREDLATEIYNAVNKYRQENRLSVFTRVSTYNTFATQYLSYKVDGQPKPDLAGHAANYSTSEGSWDVEDLVPIIGGADFWHGGTSVSVKVAQKGDNYYICFATYAVKE